MKKLIIKTHIGNWIAKDEINNNQEILYNNDID